MKHFLLVTALLFSVFSYAQVTEKPPKIRYSTGFFSTKWEIGDKDKTPNEVQLHLDKYDNDASYNFKRARSLEKQTTIFLLLGTAGMAVGLFAGEGNEEVALAGYGSAVVFYSISLGTIISSKKKYEKAVNGYNKKFGY